MDIITKGFLEQFVEDFDIHKLSESDQFELFGIYSVMYKEYGISSFNSKKLLTGNSTQGIDGIGILVNNRLVTEVKEVEDLLSLNNYLDVQFIFIQTKTSSNFNNQEMENFFRGVKNFIYNKNPYDLFSTEEMHNFLDIKDFIYSNTRYFKNRNPYASMYFITTGKWTDDKNLVSLIDENSKEIENGGLFEKIKFYSCGAKEIQELYRKTRNQVSATIFFKDKVTLAPIPNVKEAYSGFLPFNEYKKIIIDTNGKIKPVFEDNIRDYLEQTDNTVNQDINRTITNGDFSYFSILNNGVTVVAEEKTGAGDEMTITDYQIVNGCQTSHVLFDNKHIEGIENINVPVKIIVTNDEGIKNQITRATNNQTAVTSEQLESLSEYQRKLELFYKAFNTDYDGLVYERRTNQYSKTDIPRFKIINIETQVKTFAAMFSEKPSYVSGYYGKVLSSIEGEIFQNEHQPIIYYMCAYVFLKVDKILEENVIPKEYSKMRWHILMILKYLLLKGRKMEPLNSNSIKKWCEEVLNSISKDDELIKNMVLEAKDIIDASKVNVNDRKTPERKGTTDIILCHIRGF
ncbi:conserved hypothetical protein (plasmid) [Bacillus cereus W]|uniref:AIPR family protein n=1 Tax=Bacillus anthracis TaxID=1392 RepID=UPI00016B6963|nr:AIPR family protein [Bacillus anthracis]EDX54308.1 conserved hypothetical protein [Bacillus cereus W]MEB9530323.1 AIPR family protein [Bacillus anthracis]MEC0043742.1 AIPR family protein [Bacillus anthracis]